MRILALVIIWGFVVQCSIGQIDSNRVHDSPYSVIYNHLYYLQKDSYRPQRAALSLPPGIDNPEQKAIMLKQVLDGRGFFLDLNRIPKSGSYQDSSRAENIYLVNEDEERIYLEKVDTSWYYSRTTMDVLGDLHRSIYPFGEISTRFDSPFWNVSVLGIPLVKWIGFLLVVVISILVGWLIRTIMTKVILRVYKIWAGEGDQHKGPIGMLSFYAGLIAGLRFFVFVLPMLQLHPQVNSMLITLTYIVTLILVILAALQLVNLLFVKVEDITEKTESTLDDQLVPVVRKIVKLIILGLGLILILDRLDVNITALLAGISLGGLALALAAQDTLKNFFGSIMIFVDRPFQIGDSVSFDGVEGVIEEVGLRSTRIRTFANSLVYTPNGTLADKIIDNLGMRKLRRFKTSLGVTYDTPTAVIDGYVEGVRRIVSAHPSVQHELTQVHLNSLGDSSINILVYVFFEVPTWTEELKGRHDLISAFLTLADKMGVSFAFPTQSIHIESQVTPSKDTNGGDWDLDQKKIDQTIEAIEKYFKE